MKFKTELHAHTREVSRCSQTDAARMVQIYKQNGYRTLTITDHFSSDTFPDWRTDDWDDMVERYLRGYRTAKALEDDRFTVLLSMEIRFCENNNDYLVFGVNEAFLRAHPRLIDFGIEKFVHIAREHGLLTIQAHPFRTGMTVTDPRFLDGVEVRNRHPVHDSRNEVCAAWAARFPQLIRTSGTDFHEPDFPTTGGILTEQPITSEAQLVETLKSGGYTLL